MSIQIKTTTNYEEAEISIHLVIKNWGIWLSWREILILRSLNKRSKSLEGTCSLTLMCFSNVNAVIIPHKEYILFDISSKLKDTTQQTLLKLHSHLNRRPAGADGREPCFLYLGLLLLKLAQGPRASDSKARFSLTCMSCSADSVRSLQLRGCKSSRTPCFN